MSFEAIQLSRRVPVALLDLNRPDKLSAIDAVMIDEINRALDDIENDDTAHALVVYGNGRGFSFGVDLQAGVDALIVRRKSGSPCLS